MAVRMLLVLLTLTGLVPAGECTCASARHATEFDRGGERHPVALPPSADPAGGDHDHDDSHPIHHHPTCPALDAQLGLPVALAPAPFGVPAPSDSALAVWGMGSPDPSASRCRSPSTSSPSTRTLPLYLSQSALQI